MAGTLTGGGIVRNVGEKPGNNGFIEFKGKRKKRVLNLYFTGYKLHINFKNFIPRNDSLIHFGLDYLSSKDPLPQLVF